MTEPIRFDILGIGIVGPGLAGWPQTRDVLRGATPYTRTATVVPATQWLPATERRRAGTIIKVSIAAADEALGAAGLDPAQVATVFAASEGDGRNCHDLCEALASSDRLVSPTRFTNSVHNAPAGYWHIATHSMASSTSLCAYDASFAAGLLEAAMQAMADDKPVLLVVADAPYPEPLNATRALPDAMAVAMLVARPGAYLAAVHLMIDVRAHSDDIGAITRCTDRALDVLTRELPAARGLPLLEAIARRGGGSGDGGDGGDGGDDGACTIACFDDLALHLRVHPAS